MYYRCCVPNCKSIRQQVKLHQIPVGSVGESRKLWVKAIVAVSPNITDQIYRQELHKLFICHKHFERRFISEKNRVVIDGYPSLFTEEEIASGVPSKVDPEFAARDSARAVARDHACTRRFHVDHTYVKINDGDQWMEQLIVSGIPGFYILRQCHHRLQRVKATAWATYCWPDQDWSSVKSLTSLYESNKVLCGRHFEDSCYTENCKKRLSRYAVPGTKQYVIKTLHSLKSKISISSIVSATGTQRNLETCIEVNPDAKDTQIEAAPEIEPAPEVEEAFDPDYELHVSRSPLPEVDDSGPEAVFSWQNEEELIEADDPEEPPAPADPTLALFCESDPEPDPGAPAQRAHAAASADPGPASDPDPGIVFDPQPDQAVPSLPAPVDNRCKDCGEVNEGFEFWCVQCAGGALCGACAGRAPHHAHYVLRAPMGCSRARTQVVLTMIRQQLLQNQNLSQHGTVDDDLKLEVKEEPTEVSYAEFSAAEPDPLACEPMGSREMSLDDTLVPEFPHDLVEPLEPVSLRSPISLHSPRSSSRSPYSPPPSCPASPPEPVVTPEPATHEADESIAEKIFEYHEMLRPPRPRNPTDAHEEILIPTQCKLVSPAEVKRAFLSHKERVVTTQNKQLKAYQPLLELTQVRGNVVTTQHEGPTYEGNSRTTRLQARGQATMKVTSEPQPSEIVTIDLDVADETVEYLEEGLESDIETVDNVDNYGHDVLDEGDLEEPDLEEDDLSDVERILRNVPGRGVKRKKDAEETLPLKGPSESMVRALPSKAVIQVRPLSSLEIRYWTADRKRLRKD